LFANERSRPFFDLLARIIWERIQAIADLGCGSGELTAALAERWPEATVVGVDNSRAMLRRAQDSAVPGRVEFVQADVAAWRGPAPAVVRRAPAAPRPARGSLGDDLRPRPARGQPGPGVDQGDGTAAAAGAAGGRRARRVPP